jgi:hypothetical protein
MSALAKANMTDQAQTNGMLFAISVTDAGTTVSLISPRTVSVGVNASGISNSNLTLTLALAPRAGTHYFLPLSCFSDFFLFPPTVIFRSV